MPQTPVAPHVRRAPWAPAPTCPVVGEVTR